MNFECHITVNKENLERLIELGKVYNWKTSYITDDPILGPGKFFYFTRHNADYIKLHNSMIDMSDRVTERGFKVIRQKIELIMYDSRI